MPSFFFLFLSLMTLRQQQQQQQQWRCGALLLSGKRTVHRVRRLARDRPARVLQQAVS